VAAAIADLGRVMALEDKNDCRRFPDATVGAGGDFIGMVSDCTGGHGECAIEPRA